MLQKNRKAGYDLCFSLLLWFIRILSEQKKRRSVIWLDHSSELISGYDLFDQIDVGYVCDCSRERMLRAVKSLGKEELEKIFKEQKTVEVCCRFCSKKFSFDKSIME